MSNIPEGYDENGVRAGDGHLDDVCPNCGSKNVFRNGSDEIQCDDCGYSETE